MEPKKDKERKGGFWAYISGLFGKAPLARGGLGSASGLGGASGLGSAGSGLGGLFATKAGIVGMVLGGATIAAGVGVIYNFLGPSSKSGYTPQLFQSAYYDEQTRSAGLDRSRQKSAAVESSLDMFKEQAKKDGLALGEDAESAGKKDSGEKPADETADGAAEAGAAPDAAAAPGGGPKLQSASGFGGGRGGGGSGTSMPQLSGGGGMSGGINSKFAPIYKAPAGQKGKTSGLAGSMAASVKGGKYSLPPSKKGAHGQAKFAKKMGAKAVHSTDAGARTTATEAFSGETVGSGDVGAPDGGAGLGGAGLSGGNKLKASDPNMDGSSFTPPKVPEPEDVSPWNDLRDEAMKYILISMGLIVVTKIFAKIAKAVPFMYYVAFATAVAAIAAALKVIWVGYKLYKGDPNGDPPWTGQLGLAIPMIAAGVMLAIAAWNALCDMAGQTDVAAKAATTTAAGTTPAVSAAAGAPGWMSGLGGMGLGNVLGGL